MPPPGSAAEASMRLRSAVRDLADALLAAAHVDQALAWLGRHLHRHT